MVGNVQPVFNIRSFSVDKRAKQAVPNWEHISKIAVSPRHLVMMMKFVHIRGYNYVAERFVQLLRKWNIGVGEIGKKHAQNSVKKIESDWHSHNHNGNQSESFPNNKIEGMVARARGHVNIFITMMHGVQPPHPLYFVEQIVHKILRNQIQNQDGKQQFQPNRPIKKL